MNIFIDESGLFVPSNAPNSWSAVGAYVTTERSRVSLDTVLMRLKKDAGVRANEEIKLKSLDAKPSLYPTFLAELDRLDGVLYASVANAFLDGNDAIKSHQTTFVENIQNQIPRMRHESGKASMQILAAQVSGLPPQLYAQLFHQTGLIEFIARSAIIYFVQRYPATLRAFRWRIDRKDTRLSSYEDTFRKIVPMLLQASSIREPSMLLRGFDYSHLSEYWMPIPEYLKQDYGIELEQQQALDLQKIFRTDLQFLDSKKSTGLQVIDLLISGIRRCMRGDFKDQNDQIAKLLGRLMVQPVQGEPVVRVLTFSSEQYLTGEGRRAVMIMNRHRRTMLV